MLATRARHILREWTDRQVHCSEVLCLSLPPAFFLWSFSTGRAVAALAEG